MYTLFTVIMIIISILLILIVLVQNSKGGGLASDFTGSNQIMGVRRTTDFLEKATWGLAIALVVFSLLAHATSEKTKLTQDSMVQEEVSKMPANTIPTLPEKTDKPTVDPNK